MLHFFIHMQDCITQIEPHTVHKVFNKAQHRPTHGDIGQFICASMWVHGMQGWTIQVDSTENKSSTYVALVSKKEDKIKTNKITDKL